MSLILTHNGHEWHGTFGVLVTALATDLTQEGPVRVRITRVMPARRPYTETSTLRGVEDNGCTLVTSGGRVAVDDVLTIEVL